ATRSGIHRLDLQSRQWEHGYFRYRLTANGNDLVLYLADAPLAADDYELWAALLALPILDRRDFVESWRIVPPDFSWYHYGTSTALWPHYRDALFALVERPEADRRSWRGSTFPVLLDLVLGPPEMAPARKLSVIKRLLAEGLSGEYRKWLVARLHQPGSSTPRFSAEELAAAGIDVEALQAEASLYLLLSSSRRPENEGFSELCWLIAEDKNVAKRFWALVAEGFYGADVMNKCLELVAQEKQAAALEAQADCVRYEIPPDMPAAVAMQRLQAAEQQGGAPEGFIKQPCSTPERSFRKR
ncbi:MAG TPA: hypothetical protein VFY81_03950, partial [Gammaproteobacteria bacterium]|nr:hypothetical protein [Gammaproteobacteria bacterium]